MSCPPRGVRRRCLLASTSLSLALSPVAGAAQSSPIPVLEDVRPVAAPRTPLESALWAEDVVESDPESYDLRWRAAEAFAVAAMAEPEGELAVALGYRARLHAMKAVAVDPSGLEGHYWRAVASGLLADLEGGRTSIRLAEESWNESGWVLAADSSHAGAHYLRGRIHAAAQRMSSIVRFFARHILGADVLARTSWEGAVNHLERAASLEPESPMHYFELAAVYRDLDRTDDMIWALRATVEAEGTEIDVIDERYRQRARALLDAWEAR